MSGKFIRLLSAVALFVTAVAGHANVLISQVYGGGGNSGAIYQNDFIERFNAGSSPQRLSGWSVQYASVTGTAVWRRLAIDQCHAATGPVLPDPASQRRRGRRRAAAIRCRHGPQQTFGNE